MDKIGKLLTRGVERIYPSREKLEQVLRSGKKLRLYQGFDPTGDKLHIGHMVGLRKHREWQDLGHEVIFLVGDGTGQAGDPSGRKKTREKFFTREELRANAKDYLTQAGKIVRFEGPNPIKILYNGDWLNKLTLVDILNIAQHFSVQQFIERDMFQERMKMGESINLREFLYPLLQGYDSVAMDVDLELGGSDQTFNMLAGRTLLRAMKGKEKFVMTTPLLSDSGGVKVGKSENNVIGLTDSAPLLFGKIMSFRDDAIIPLFTLLTDVPLEEIAAFNLKKNAMILKKRVASLIVAQLCGKASAEEAEESFVNIFQKGKTPEMMTKLSMNNAQSLMDLLVQTKNLSSKSEFRRLIKEGAVTNLKSREKVNDPNFIPRDGQSFKIGKKTFVKIVKK